MKAAPRLAILLATLAASAIACGPKRIAGPSRPGDEMVVLLPDSEDGSVGRARVSNASGSVDLDAERDTTQVAASQGPGPVNTLRESDLRRIFGDALSALPPPPRRFTLQFRFESDELTDDSRALVPEILRAVKEHTLPDVVVVGHTDTAGTLDANFQLGMKRAMTVRDLLVEAGLDASAIEVTSHGEGDLLIQTADETPELRNRRVEIAVR
jgi:OmpA-OmpF porin, OOP family